MIRMTDRDMMQLRYYRQLAAIRILLHIRRIILHYTYDSEGNRLTEDIKDTGGGNVTPTVNLQNGVYQTQCTTGPVPAINTIEAEGQATITIPEVFYDSNAKTYIATSQSPPMRTVTLKSGQMVLFNINTGAPVIPVTIPPTQKLQYTVFGVLPEITGTTPEVMVLESDGYLAQDTTINYSIKPDEYNAIIADIDIYERPVGSTNPDDDEYAFSLTGDKTQGDGTAIIYQGEYFDVTKEYYAEIVLNRGSEVEIRSERIKIGIAELDICFATCESPCLLGVKENLVYADGIRDTKATVLVQTKGKMIDFTKLITNVQTDYGYLKDDGSSDQKKNISKFLDYEGRASLTYVSHEETAKATLQADVRDNNNAVIYSKDTEEVYNFKYCKAIDRCYDFNEIITDPQYTTTPSNLNSQEVIEAWLKSKGSGLAYRGIGEIDSTQTIIPVDSGDNNNAAIPYSGVIKIENEEITYSGKTTTEFYVPTLIATQRGANGTTASMHGDIQENTNISVSLRTTLTSALSPTDTTINVASTAGAVKRKDDEGNLRYFIRINNAEIKCTELSGNSFTACKPAKQTYAANTPVFYEIGRLGALVSRVIDYETKNEIKRLNIGSDLVVEIGTGTLIGPGKPVSAALMLTHLQKESQLIGTTEPKSIKLNTALGVKTDDQNLQTCLLDQLARGIATARNRFYEITHGFPIISGTDKIRLYVQPKDNNKKEIPVRFEINNKATKSLFAYTPYVTSMPVSSYGGNALFWTLWDQYGFNK